MATAFSRESLAMQGVRARNSLAAEAAKVDMQLQYNKITNLKLAVQRLDGLIIHPGETFSYWRRIGKPTRQKGYMEGMVLYYGDLSPAWAEGCVSSRT